MSLFQAVILGIVQGLTEFIPISSSAHLVIIPWLFRWDDPGLSFDLALHLGTLIALLSFFWSDWVRLVQRGSPASSSGKSAMIPTGGWPGPLYL